jgi:hypothetical protein
MEVKPKHPQGISSNCDSAQLSVRMASDAALAVVVARYSNSKSRMLLWETDRDVFHPGQWLKGGIELLDVSADGQYVAYYVTAPSRPVDYYIAISKPPFLTALFLRPVSMVSGGIGYFRPEGGFFWAGMPQEGSWVPGHPEYGYTRTEPGCPFEIGQVKDYDRVRQTLREKEIARLSTISRPLPPIGVTWDHQGRQIFANGRHLIAIGKEDRRIIDLLDMSKTTWSFVESPEWAKRW